MRLFVLLLAVASAPALANELRVLSGGAAKSFIDPLAASFAGAKVTMDYQPMGRLVKSLADGAAVDMVVVTSEVAEQLRLQGTPVARVGIGVAVHESAPLPDLSTPEAFRQLLLRAKSVVYIDPKTGTSGKHVAEIFQKLNIEKEMKAKSTLGQGGYVTEPVGRGEIEVGIHQISEILPVKGARLAGPLPPALQKYTTYVAVDLKNAAAARDFIAYLSSDAAKARLAAAGYTSPQ